MIEIFPAESSYASEIAKVGKKAFQHFFENENNREELLKYIDHAFSKENIAREFLAPQNVFLVAKEKGRLIGFSRLWLDDCHHAPVNGLKMERLYLEPERVGTGLGAQLMQASIDYCAQRGYKTLWLQVLRSNERAYQFYKDWGFSHFHKSPGKFKADKEIDYWMAKKI